MNGASCRTILMADDDADDRTLAADALAESNLSNELRFVENGEQLLDYLRRRGRFASAADSPRPGLILLDLNVPRLNGLEALAALKADPQLRSIPVVVLTTSRAVADVVASYDLGASSFVTKPESFGKLVETLTLLGKYWFEVAELPPRDSVDVA